MQVHHACQILGVKVIHDPESKADRWVSVSKEDCGIKNITKCATFNITQDGQNFTVKALTPAAAQAEHDKWTVLKSHIATPDHNLYKVSEQVTLLVRGPMTYLSLGDVVYKYLVNPEGLSIDRSTTDGFDFSAYEYNTTCVENLERLRVYCESTNLQLPITLDNLTTDGLLYDYEDLGTGDHNINIALADYVRYHSTNPRQAPVIVENWFPRDYSALIHGSWLDKVLAFNNNLLHCDKVQTALMAEGKTKAYHNTVLGTHEIDHDRISKVQPILQDLYYVQDPSYHSKWPVASVGNLPAIATGPEVPQGAKQVFYDAECYDYLKSHGINVDHALEFTYYQGTSVEVTKDFMYYLYQGKLFLQPHILEFLYKQTLEDFQSVATDYRLTYAEAKPRHSSVGMAPQSLMSVKQDDIYELLEEQVVDECLDLVANTPLVFSTKICQKFANTKKARARTIASCSMFASTVFRVCHKAVTNNFVKKAKAGETHCLIGVSKFYKEFSHFFNSRYGDINQYNIFGSDYTKCDRSFPAVFRAAASALLFELGGFQSDNYMFVNEMAAFCFDQVFVGNAHYQKTGGTSSGDATTAFANTLYNHMVHLYVQLMTVVSTPNDAHPGLKSAAAKLIHTGDYQDYMYALRPYNNTIYRFNFLSDDSFILSKKDAPFDIFRKDNFSRKLETLIHSTVDQDKAWESEGSIHEFCSAHIANVNGALQFIPEQERILAGLLITGKACDDNLKVLRTAALITESAVYYYVDPAFFSTLWAYFQHLIHEYETKYNIKPLPDAMCHIDFFLSLLENRDNASIAESVFAGELDLQSKAITYCIGCTNITASTCTQCPVAYPLCAYCAYAHYKSTGHVVNKLPTCVHANCTAPVDDMYYQLTSKGVSSACSQHKDGFSVPIFDHINRSIRIPYAAECIRTESKVAAISSTSDQLSDDVYQWDNSQSSQYNILKLSHDSILENEYSQEQEPMCTYTVNPDGTLTVVTANGEDPCYGYTTYCNIYDDRGRVRLTATLDPLGSSVYKLTLAEVTQLHTRLCQIRRVEHTEVVPKIQEYEDLFNYCTLIIGPPGTGKTTYFHNNFFNSDANIVYLAPTHKLVADIDASLDSDTSVLVSKYNNRTYKNPVNTQARIQLATINTAPHRPGAVLLIDEFSLSSPLALFQAMQRVGSRKIYLVGDPFQLAPVVHLRNFNWDYNNFYLTKLIPQSRVSYLQVCYRCPRNIFNTFAGYYQRHKIPFTPHKEGGTVNWHTIGYTITDDFLKSIEADLIITNYKAVVIQCQRLNINAVTIDSCQGMTIANVAVVLVGSTNFTKELNRLNVAFSTATTTLSIYCTPIIKQHIDNNLSVQLQSQLLAKDSSRLIVADIEFYHVRDRERECPNFLGLGEITVLTTTAHTTYLRPYYHRNGKYQEPLDKDIVVSARWKYMLRHLPSRVQSDINTSQLLHHINNTTDLTEGPAIFVLFNGKNDVEALKQLSAPSAQCHCGQPARFLAGTPLCQKCIKPHHTLTHFEFVIHNIESERCLEVTHAAYCNTYHGIAHGSNADVAMTACLASYLISGTFNHFTTAEGLRKITFSTQDRHNRLFGTKLIYDGHITTNLAYPAIVPTEPCSNHSTEYQPNLYSGLRSCHPTSRYYVCTNCIQHHNRQKQLQHRNAALGYVPTEVDLQLTQHEKTLKLTADIVSLDKLYVRIGTDTPILVPYFSSLDQTIRRFTNATSTKLPSTNVILGLACTCTIGITHPYLPVKTIEELKPWDLPLTIKHINFPEYILCTKPITDSARYAAFTLGYDSTPFSDPSTPFTLYRVTDKTVEITTLYSTGRLDRKDETLYPGEEVTENVHIELGDTNKTVIGGAHLYPKAYINSQYTVTHDTNGPLWHSTVAKAGSCKVLNSTIDCHSALFLAAVKDKLSQATVSLKTTIEVDFTSVPIMIWGNTNNLQTAYLQAADHVFRPVQLANHYIQYQVVPCEMPRNLPDLSHNFRPEPNSSPDVSAMVQMCSYINQEAKIPSTAVIYTNAKDEYYSVLDHFFNNSCYSSVRLTKKLEPCSYAILEHPADLEEVTSYLHYGGSLLFTFSNHQRYNAIPFQSFVTHATISPRALGFNSQLFCELKYRLPSPRLVPIYDYQESAIATKLKHPHISSPSTLDLGTLFKPHPVQFLMPQMLARMTDRIWATGRFQLKRC
ncbi:ORF1B [Serpentovirinae sp. isolate K48]|nr:ORF1B [Serpentovirinae sp.]QFU19760.1 ORF1B [Serpentovirinae sp.]